MRTRGPQVLHGIQQALTPDAQGLALAGQLLAPGVGGLAGLRTRRCRHGDCQHLLNRAPEHGDGAGLTQPRLAALRQERLAVRLVAIPREKNDAPTEGGIPLLLQGVERASIQVGHPQSDRITS
jgi:hypothetical protein